MLNCLVTGGAGFIGSKGSELWVINGWHWLERRLMHRERQFAQLDSLSDPGIAG